jgi:SAM-dependent methyltransferase
VLIERPRCPVCRSTSSGRLYDRGFDEPPIRDYLVAFYPGFREPDLELLTNGRYTLERCPSCTLVWQRWAPSADLLQRLYGSWALETSGLHRHDTATYYRAAAEEIMLVLELVGRRPSDISLLDFGMGWGQWAGMARAFGCQVHGIELDSEQIEHARQLGIEALSLDTLPDAAFDFVNAEQVFEHLVEPRETLVRLARALKPGGWLKIGVPDGHGIEERLRDPDWNADKGSGRSLNAVAPLEHLNCFTQAALARLADEGGLQRARPPARAHYVSTVGLWPPRRLVRGLLRPPLRRLSPGSLYCRRPGS